MKKQMLNTLLAAGVLLCGSNATASHQSDAIERHAFTLASLASSMEDEFSDDLREMHKRYGPSRAERSFTEALCQLAAITAQFRRSVERCAPAHELERGFEAMQEAFASVEENAEDVRVCASVQGMMRRFEDTLECLEDVGFEPVRRGPDFDHGRGRGGHDHDHGHQHRGEPLQGSNTGRIEFRVPLPQGLPFVFRQPVR